MNEYSQKHAKKNQQFSAAELSGMKHLLSGIKKARETATGKLSLALCEACDGQVAIKLISG